jgi:hypothetical protein
VPDAYEYAKKLVDYNTSSKDWTFETLDELVAAIRAAIANYDYRALDRYRAKVNFFAMSWKRRRATTTPRPTSRWATSWREPHPLQRDARRLVEPARGVS